MAALSRADLNQGRDMSTKANLNAGTAHLQDVLPHGAANNKAELINAVGMHAWRMDTSSMPTTPPGPSTMTRCDWRFEQFLKQPSPYAILSHRWTDYEPSLQDIEQGDSEPSPAHHKIHGFAEYVKSHLPQLKWLWVDSCCIDQKSAAELSEGVNCMFDWYRNAMICIAYLPDVQHPSDRLAFRQSVWFKRGWTLQELLASTVVVFVTDSWQVIGHKGDTGHLEAQLDSGPNLEAVISETTGIPTTVLRDFSNSHVLSVDQRMRWMDGRETTKEEDMFYALFGIFGVTPGANYGEKRLGAERRLRKAIEEKQHDGSFSGPAGTISQSAASRCFIPFARDPAFVERRELMIAQQKLSRPGARVALAGLGGIGKSQVAIEHCYRTMDAAPDTWVLWLHASSATRFDQELLSLIDDLNIADKKDKDTNIFQLLRAWLINDGRPWLVVLDNADDADFLFQAPDSNSEKSSRKARIDYFPVCGHGSMLITTRRRSTAQRLAARDDIIVLEAEPELATELLRTKLRLPEATAAVEKLATSLDCIPLAIAQAAAYINQREPRCTIEDYSNKFERSERSKESLLKAQSDDLGRDRQEAENSVLLTWQISFEHIRTVRPSAADLLSLMSFYDHQGIPESVLKSDPQNDDGGDTESDNDSADDTEEVFEESIVMLRDYSFVYITTDKSILQMHQLVQMATQVWLRKETMQYERVQAQSLNMLDEAYPHPHFEYWKRCQMLQPHAKHISGIKVKDDGAILALSSIMLKAGWFAESQGMYAEAEMMAARSLRECKRVLGEEHPATLKSMNNLALTYSGQGRYDDAAQLQVKVLELTKRVLGDEHPSTLASMNNLMPIYRGQGRYDDAAQLLVKVLELEKRVLGEEHPNTLISMGNLASTYSGQGRHDDAAQLQVKVLELRKRVLGEEHPNTLISMGNLASTYSGQGRYDDAAQLLVKVLELRKRVLGEEHPSTLISMGNLALTYNNQGRYDDAAQLQVKVLELRKRVLGEEHPNTLISMGNLASTYSGQGRYDDAAQLQVKVLEVMKRVLGDEHPDTLISMGNLALTYSGQGRYDDAAQLQVKVLEVMKRVLGDEHPDTLSSMSNLASAFFYQNKLQRARELMAQCLQRRKAVLGDTHPDTLNSDGWLQRIEAQLDAAGSYHGVEA